MENLTFLEKVNKIQTELNAPKSQRNNFGKYNYRSMEDINEAVKPLLAKYGLVMTITDELTLVGDRYYVKATASLIGANGDKLEATAYAREALSKKGMDESQITGSASSYARKYAANGLLAIDDSKDADFLNNNKEYTQKVNSKPKNTRAEAKPIQPKELPISEEDAKALQASMTLNKENAEIGKQVMRAHKIERISNFTQNAMVEYYTAIQGIGL